MNANVTPALDVSFWDDTAIWPTAHGTGQWPIKDMDAEFLIVPYGSLSGSVEVYHAFSRPKIHDKTIGLSRSFASTLAPGSYSDTVNRSQLADWNLNPIRNRDAESDMFELGTQQAIGDARSSFGKIAITVKHTGCRSWTVVEVANDLGPVLDEIFSLAEGEDFENGVETRFSLEIGRFIVACGFEGVVELRRAVEQDLYRETYLAEALVWIGELDDDSTVYERRALLENACGSESASLRDAAVTGISYLGAAESKARLERMLDLEHVRGVRAHIEAVLAYLRV